MASAEGPVSGGKWGPVSSSPALKSGTYTAVAEEASSLGNSSGDSEPRTFVVNTEPPVVTLTPIKSRSKVTKPTFHATVTEAGPVTVHLYSGKEAKGTEIAKYTVTATAPGEWGVVASPALEDGVYTALATEPSALGNGEGESETRTFEIDTEPPEVTLNSVPTPSNTTKPSFSGTASESLPVTVKIYSGPKVEGSPVASAEGPVSGGKWGAISSTTTLTSGTYTAVAVEQSSLENAAGESTPVTFVINTLPPVVTVEAPPARSKENKPTFKGTASEAGTVMVHVYKGSEAKGEEAAKPTATVTEGKWSASVPSTLPDGKYTLQATELSALGNGTGKSEPPATFEVFTKPPTVTMEELAARSKENKPTFKGTASEPGPVTVHVYKGKEAKGTEAAKLTATVGAKGEWSVSPATILADETYTAVATEPSAIGNEAGESKPPRTFEVFTIPPTVKITHGAEERSNQTKPTFEGEASETEPVTVHIYEGTGTSGTEVVSLPATVSSEHKWHVSVSDSAGGREVHRAGRREEFARQRRGQERTAADLRSLHQAADRDPGTAEGTVQGKSADVQGNSQRTGRRDGARLQGQRSERDRSRETDGHGRGQRRMVGLAGHRRCRTKPTPRSRSSRARSATKKVRANPQSRSKSSRSRRRSRSPTAPKNDRK